MIVCDPEDCSQASGELPDLANEAIEKRRRKRGFSFLQKPLLILSENNAKIQDQLYEKDSKPGGDSKTQEREKK